MDVFDIEDALRTMTIIYDTREHDTPALRRRLAAFPCPTKREMCKSGDYSVTCTLPGGEEYSLNGIVNIERKMNLEELSRNMSVGKERFGNEFQRAIDGGGKLYLLVEDGSFDMILMGDYNTRFHKNAYIAALMAWQARYNTQVIFCSARNAPTMIYKILYYELREHLMRLANTEGA